MGVVDFPGGASAQITTSWYGNVNGVYSTGLYIPAARQAANGQRPVLASGVRSYWGGRGGSASLRIEVGHATTGWYTVGAVGSAQETGWLPISGGVFLTPMSTHVAIRNSGTQSFYFGRAGSGGGGTFTGHNGAQAWAGALSGQVHFVEVPSAPHTPVVAVRSPTSAQVDFVAPADTGGTPITGYRIQLAENSGFTVGVRNFDTSGGGYVITGLTPGRTYYVRVAAKNAVTAAAGTTSPWSGSRSFSTAGPPSAPTVTGQDMTTQTTLRFLWNAPATDNGAPVISYEGQLATNSGFTQGVVNFSQSAASGRNRTFSNLKPSTRYYFRVRAINAAGTGGYSNTGQGVTQDGAEHFEGGAWQLATAEVFDGTKWVTVSPEFFNGSAWVD